MRIALPMLVAAVLLTSCAPAPTDSKQTPPAVPVDDAAQALVRALNAFDVHSLSMNNPAESAQVELEKIFAGMDGIKPKVKSAAKPVYSDDGKAATVDLELNLPVAQNPWIVKTQAKFSFLDNKWRLNWSPTIIHPQLTSQTRLRRQATEPRRAAILEANGQPLVESGTLFQVGVDKATLAPAKVAETCSRVATLLKIDAKAYAKKCQASGAKQFVVARTLPQEQVPEQLSGIVGALVRETRGTVGPADNLAKNLLGVTGHPSAEMVKKSGGKLASTDIVGLSGLQARYDAQLGGVPGVEIALVPRDKQAKGKAEPKVVFQQEPSVGRDITISLNRAMQAKAEQILKSKPGIAAITVVDVKTGGVLVAAESEKAGAYPYATFGKWAPGSTFKVASALALVRKGMTAESKVSCPSQLRFGNFTFNNYPGYSNTGTIRLSDAIAYSCNTAFISQASRVSQQELAEAAGSLGLGIDYDAGFRSYFGTVKAKDQFDHASAMIGQGQVTASPLAMAAVAASVAKGETVIPWLVKGHQAKSKAKPLTPGEVDQLRQMMSATISRGTGKSLAGVLTGAKSGTAQFGEQGKLKTHAWMIGYNSRYAVAAFVNEGSSGGTDAAPMIKQLLG